MTNRVCALCGAPGTTATMAVSRHSGNAFCLDTHGCNARLMASKLPTDKYTIELQRGAA